MYTSSRSILWIVGFSFGSNSTWKDVTTSHSMFWPNQCTVGLSPSNNCIREFRSFAPIFLGNDCLRVRYLDISFTGRVEWRQWQLKSQEILLRAGERFCCAYLGRVECHMVLCQCFFIIRLCIQGASSQYLQCPLLARTSQVQSLASGHS